MNPQKGKKGKKGPPRKDDRRKVTEDTLDNELDSYWKKSNDPEIIARVEKEQEDRRRAKAAKEEEALDKQLDSYWEQKKKEDEAKTATEETK